MEESSAFGGSCGSVRFLGLTSVSICSATESSKCQGFRLKIKGKDLIMNCLIRIIYALVWMYSELKDAVN